MEHLCAEGFKPESVFKDSSNNFDGEPNNWDAEGNGILESKPGSLSRDSSNDDDIESVDHFGFLRDLNLSFIGNLRHLKNK